MNRNPDYKQKQAAAVYVNEQKKPDPLSENRPLLLPSPYGVVSRPVVPLRLQRFFMELPISAETQF
jgi:hypothetical protein